MKWKTTDCLLALFLCMVFVFVVGYGAFSFGGDMGLLQKILLIASVVVPMLFMGILIGLQIWNEKDLNKLTLAKILCDYQRNGWKDWRAVLDFYGNLPDWGAAIRAAGEFHYKASNKCHPRQRCISRSARNQFALDLHNNQAAIYSSADFNNLYDNIKKFCKKGEIGEPIIYDTAMRLGAFLEKQKGGSFKPQKVFLYNDAMNGAVILFEKGWLKEPSNRMSLSAFEKLFPEKEAWEVEEILCIYKDKF